MKHTSRLESEYYSSDEMTLHAQKQFVQPLLGKFLSWLTNEKAFKQACDAQAEVDPRLLASACDITTLATSIFSPKHLGLAINLHHEFGSRKLIDDLSCLGHCVSYDELRRFITSAAEHIYGEQIITPSGAVIPPDIATRADGGQLIVGAGDNWDHNERTPDGKKTTHTMTTILVSPMVSNQVSYPRIKVSSSGTLKKQPDLSEVLPYQKPSHRPEPRLTGQVVSDSLIVRPTVNIEKAQMTEFAYQVLRSGSFGLMEMNISFPCWSAFNAYLKTDDKEAVSAVAFNPIIMAPPTDHSTIYTTMKRMKEAASVLGQSHIPVFFDMAILMKALEIKWSRDQELNGVIPFEGGLHFLMSVFSGIGSLYGDAGLQNLLCDSDVYATGSVQQIISGKDFHRAVMAYKLVEETLYRRFFLQFKKWLEMKETAKNNFEAVYVQTSNLAADFQDAQSSLERQKAIDEVIETIKYHLQLELDEFRKEGRSRSPTFLLWDDFIVRVMQPLKLYLSSSRMGNWEVHQFAKT